MFKLVEVPSLLPVVLHSDLSCRAEIWKGAVQVCVSDFSWRVSLFQDHSLRGLFELTRLRLASVLDAKSIDDLGVTRSLLIHELSRESGVSKTSLLLNRLGWVSLQSLTGVHLLWIRYWIQRSFSTVFECFGWSLVGWVPGVGATTQVVFLGLWGLSGMRPAFLRPLLKSFLSDFLRAFGVRVHPLWIWCGLGMTELGLGLFHGFQDSAYGVELAQGRVGFYLAVLGFHLGLQIARKISSQRLRLVCGGFLSMTFLMGFSLWLGLSTDLVFNPLGFVLGFMMSIVMGGVLFPFLGALVILEGLGFSSGACGGLKMGSIVLNHFIFSVSKGISQMGIERGITKNEAFLAWILAGVGSSGFFIFGLKEAVVRRRREKRLR